MPDDAALAEAPDPAVLSAEWRLRLLEEMAEINMRVARALERRTLAAVESAEPSAPDADSKTAVAPASRTASPAPSLRDLSAALDRTSRSLRLTLALHARTDEALRALRAGVAAECEARRVANSNRATTEATARRTGRRDAVERAVIEAAEREIEDGEALWGVFEALDERLEQDVAYRDLEQAPLREIVERLCADLELTPDWDRWEGEGWAPQAPFSRPRCSIWARPSRTVLNPVKPGSRLAQVLAERARQLE
jgi:hypothetical protein